MRAACAGTASLAECPEDVTIRQHSRLESVAWLGHSWGAVRSGNMRFDSRNAHSGLIVSRRPGKGIRADDEAYPDGKERSSPSAHTRTDTPRAPARMEDYERLMARMRAGSVSQGREDILRARPVEAGWRNGTCGVPSYNLLRN